MAKRAVSSGTPRTASAKSGTSRLSRLASFFKALGPGIVTGAADDDPSGIATYSQVGAQFGFTMLWTMLLTYPLMAGIQEISAWIGRVTGVGLAGNIRRHYSPLVVNTLVALLLIANVINLGADIGAMGSALQLIVGGPALLYSIVFGVISVIAAIVFPYKQYAQYLKWTTLVLFVYAGTALIVHIPLKLVLLGTFIPSLSFSNSYLIALTAVFGTTISPYLFFWQASVEVAEQKSAPREKPLKDAPHQAPAQLERMRSGTYLGMALSNIIAFFIILDTAAVLHAHGITNIQTPAQAAEALRPLAGELAFLLFSIGIIGTGLIAIPVLAGSSAYALAEALKWPIGLERKLQRAKGFYAILAVATLIGVALNFTAINPIKALFWSAVINGLAAVPIMIVMMLMTTNKKITGQVRLPTLQKVIGWIATGVMFAVAAGMIATLI
ncbi:NRAMP family divalent metal transporter [Candidatus Binatus sp.]|uniref:NRAMP family divalent metal transporter n=1 Tax=Candidatus Binatus sp. TaxID=2811406 RepID=UPI003C7153C8